VRLLACVLFGHRFEATTILGFVVRRCVRCGKAEPSD
jgi:hypothetical protein